MLVYVMIIVDIVVSLRNIDSVVIKSICDDTLCPDTSFFFE